MHFLGKVCANVSVNKMSETNAAIVFGPTLMRAKVETMATTLNTPIVNSAIQRLIEVCFQFVIIIQYFVINTFFLKNVDRFFGDS